MKVLRITAFFLFAALLSGQNSIGIRSIRDSGAKGDGRADDAGPIRDALAHLSGGCGILDIPAGIYRLANDLNIPPCVHLSVAHGAILSPDASAKLTLDSPLAAGPEQIFGGKGRIILSGGAENMQPTAYAEWWGARADNSTDNCNPLQAAITAVSGTVEGDAWDVSATLRLLSGTYRHSCTLTVKGALELSGSGAHSTQLTYTGGAGHQIDAGPYFYAHDFGMNNVGSATIGIYAKYAHEQFARIVLRPEIGYRIADIQTNTAISLYDITFDNLYLTCNGSSRTSCSPKVVSPVGLAICGGVNISGHHVYVEDKSVAQIEIGDKSCSGGSSFYCEDCTAQAFEAHAGNTAVGFWATVNATNINLRDITTQLCQSGQRDCAQRSVLIDEAYAGQIEGGQFIGGGAHGGSIKVTGGKNVSFRDNYFQSITNPDGDCVVSFSGGSGYSFSNNSYAKTATHLTCPADAAAYVAPVDLLGGAATGIGSLSEAETARHNFVGSCVIDGAQRSCVVKFKTTEPDDHFNIFISTALASGSAGQGSMNCYATGVSAAGFTAECANAPGPGNRVRVNWLLVGAR